MKPSYWEMMFNEAFDRLTDEVDRDSKELYREINNTVEEERNRNI